MPGDVGDFSVNIGLGINFLAFVSQFVTLRDTLTYITNFFYTGRPLKNEIFPEPGIPGTGMPHSGSVPLVTLVALRSV